MFVSDTLRNLLFHLVQRISLHLKSPDLYLFCTTKVFPKFLLPFQSQASFQSEQFGSYVYAPRSLSAGRVPFVKSAVAHAHEKKTPVYSMHVNKTKFEEYCHMTFVGKTKHTSWRDLSAWNRTIILQNQLPLVNYRIFLPIPCHVYI